MENEVLTAFSVLKEASQLIGKEFKTEENVILKVTNVRMDIDVACDYSIIAEYEVWLEGRLFSIGTRSYDSLLGMIAYDGK